jgi:hypothetical protein
MGLKRDIIPSPQTTNSFGEAIDGLEDRQLPVWPVSAIG